MASSSKVDPLSIEVTADMVDKLNGVDKDMERADYVLERRAVEYLTPLYEKRRAVLKTIPKFWPLALINSGELDEYINEADREALAYLEDLWVVRDPNEFRVYTLEFHFGQNPFFSDSVLTKTFTYTSKSEESAEKDAEGVSDALLDFDWERDVQSTVTRINWKNADEALTKKFPPGKSDVEGEEGDLVIGEPGSFFNFFELRLDLHEQQVASTIVDDVFPEANDYFLGRVDSDDSDEDEDAEMADA